MTFTTESACPLRDFLAQHAPADRSFDWPCGCGHTSDQCTKRADGTCDG